MPARRRALAALLLLVAGAGCGRDDAPETVRGTEPGPPTEWEEASVPLERGADTPVLTAVDGDRVLLLTVSEDGDVASAVATGDAAFETGPPLATGAELLRLGGVARFDGAWWAAGPGGTRAVPSRPDDWEPAFDLHLVRSDDGLTWTEVDATGLEGPAEVTGLVATDDGLVAVGHDQSGNLDGGDMEAGFAPRAWRSDDGTTWEPVPLEAGGAEWGPSALVAVDDGVLAVGSGDDGTVAWRSDDGGRSWAGTDLGGLDDGVRLSHVVPFGEDLLATGTGPPTEETESGAPPSLYRSADGGRSWTGAEGPPARAEGGWAPLFPAGARAFTIVSTLFDPGSDPRACYADIRQCQGGSDAVLYEGDGDGAWSRVDLSELGLGEDEEVDGAVATDDRLVLWSADGVAVRTWSTDAGATLPTGEEPTIETADVRMLEEGGEPEVGVRYAQPLYTHCGMDWLYLGEEPWERIDDGPEAGDGGTIYGFATLTADGTVEYATDDGEVIATYGPATREPEPCM